MRLAALEDKQPSKEPKRSAFASIWAMWASEEPTHEDPDYKERWIDWKKEEPQAKVALKAEPQAKVALKAEPQAKVAPKAEPKAAPRRKPEYVPNMEDAGKGYFDNDGALVILTPLGFFDYSHKGIFSSITKKAGEMHKPTKYIIDMRFTGGVDETAIQLIRELRELASAQGVGIIARNVDSDVKETLQKYGLTKVTS